jgi:hypothetical protein
MNKPSRIAKEQRDCSGALVMFELAETYVEHARSLIPWGKHAAALDTLAATKSLYGSLLSLPIQLLPPVQKGGFSPQSAALFTHHGPFLGLTFARRFVILLSPHFNFDNFRPASGSLRGRNSSQKSSVAVR